MANKNALSRRDFLKAASASAAATGLVGLTPALVAAKPSAQERTTISFKGWGATEEDEGVRAAIAQFEEEQSAVHVEWQHHPDGATFHTSLLVDFAAGVAPDTSFIAYDFYQTFIRDGLLMDITDRIESDSLLSQEDYFIQPQERNRSANAEGRWFGIGSTWVAPQIYYNADMFEAAGITPPGFKDDEIYDWDTFLDVARQLTLDGNGRHPNDAGFDPENIVQWGVDWPMWWLPIYAGVNANGGDFVNEDQSSIVLDSPEALEAMQRLADLKHVHHVAPIGTAMEALGMSNTQLLDTGRLAMAVDGSWALSWMWKVENMTLGTGAIPAMSQPATTMQAHIHSVLSSSTNADAAWEWIRFLGTPYYQTLFCKIGLWVPSLTAMLTEDGLNTWLDPQIHPANYRDFVAEYLPNHGVAARLPAGWQDATDFIQPAFDAISNGTAQAVDAMPDAVSQANAALAG